MPLLEREFNPAVVESFAELSEIARDEEDYWENEISGWLGTVVQWSEPAWTRDVQDVSFVQIEPVGGGPPQCLPMDLGLRSRIANAPWLVMNASVSRPWLLTEPRAVQRRALKAIGEQAGIPLSSSTSNRSSASWPRTVLRAKSCRFPSAGKFAASRRPWYSSRPTCGSDRNRCRTTSIHWRSPDVSSCLKRTR